MTFQVHPFKVYAMLSDGEIETSAVIARKETITAAADGSITVSNTPVAGTLYVYAEDDFGGTAIEGTLSGSTFSADSIKTDSVYTVAYLEEKTSGVQKVSFNNKKIPKNFYIQMSTLDKNENGELVPVKITAYKASPQRNLELSFSSDGDPAEITITCDALVDDDGNVLDMIELTGESN